MAVLGGGAFSYERGTPCTLCGPSRPHCPRRARPTLNPHTVLTHPRIRCPHMLPAHLGGGASGRANGPASRSQGPRFGASRVSASSRLRRTRWPKSARRSAPGSLSRSPPGGGGGLACKARGLVYRGTSLIRNHPFLGPHSRTMPMILRRS